MIKLKLKTGITALLALIICLFFLATTAVAADEKWVIVKWEKYSDTYFGADALVTDCGYNLHIGTASGNYNPAIDVACGVMYATLLSPGTYFFALTAYNKHGETGYSEEKSCTIDEPPIGEPPGGGMAPVIIEINAGTVTVTETENP